MGDNCKQPLCIQNCGQTAASGLENWSEKTLFLGIKKIQNLLKTSEV